MPIYEYRCDKCDQVFEALQRISDKPIDACRHCGGAAHRIVSSPAIQFLGSGWYVTDYARKKNQGEKNAPPPDGSSAKSGPAAKPGSANAAGKEKSGDRKAVTSDANASSSGGESRAGSPS